MPNRAKTIESKGRIFGTGLGVTKWDVVSGRGKEVGTKQRYLIDMAAGKMETHKVLKEFSRYARW